jgi:hypothetical protein
MIKNLQPLQNQLLLHVNVEPVQSIRRWTPMNEKQEIIGEEQIFTQELLTGQIMTKLLSLDTPIVAEIQFRSSQMASLCPDAPNYGDVLKAFIRNEEDLMAGTKLMLVTTAMLPRVNKSGDKKGLATNFSPVVSGFSIVDATEEDTAFLNSFKKCDAVPTAEEVEAMNADLNSATKTA